MSWGPKNSPSWPRPWARGIVELKKAAASLKESFEEEDEKQPSWGPGDMDQHPNKLLEAYNDLPEDAMPERPAPVTAEKTDADAEVSPTTEEISHAVSAETEDGNKENKSSA